MLGWSINLFRIFGIQLAVHASFVLLLAYFGWQGWLEGGAMGMAWSILLIVAFFGCVVLHELGHSLTARRFGVRTPRILLMPIGGMAEMDRIPRRPLAEFLITIAGPAVNFLLVVILVPFFWHDALSSEEVAAYTARDLGVNLLLANAVMGVFNLLPVFPMDGGRILRALLATRLPYLRATWWAVNVGKVLAGILAVLAAFYWNRPFMAVLFVFIYFAADAEYRYVRRREQEALYWAEMARRATALQEEDRRPDDPLPPLIHGPN